MQQSSASEVVIIVQTTNGVKHRVTVPTNLSINELRQTISIRCTLNPVIPAVGMMVIFKGRILRCSQTVQEVGIGMDDLVVVMHVNEKKKNNRKRKLVPTTRSQAPMVASQRHNRPSTCIVRPPAMTDPEQRPETKRRMVRPASESTYNSALPRGTQEYNLGTNYFHGRGGLRQDYSMSYLLWTRAADEGKAFV